jgi:peptidoglycan hydrolase-like protein with peptidoglycan-binding domain
MQGDDVKLLHAKLRQLGYAVPTTEVATAVFGAGTYDAVASFQAKNGLPVTNVVDATTADNINAAFDGLQSSAVSPGATATNAPANLVRGEVRGADARPLSGVMVQAFDKQIKSERLLGTTTASSDGRYEISYSAGSIPPNLVVRVFRPSAHSAGAATGAAAGPTAVVVAPELLASSEVFFNAPPLATINIMVGGGVYAGPTEYEQLTADLAPRLDGTSVGDLTQSEVAFLASESGQGADQVRLLSGAERLAREAGLPTEVFYGMARQGLPFDLSSLLSTSAETRQVALQGALDANQAPPALRSSTAAILDKIDTTLADAAVKSESNQALALAISDAKNLQVFHQLWVRHTGPVEEFWTALAQRAEFAQTGTVDEIKLAIQLAVLTLNHLPMLQQLLAFRKAGKWKSLRDLAAFQSEDWLRLVNAQHVGAPSDMPGKSAEQKSTNYARFMMSMVEQAFPTAAIAQSMQRGASPAWREATTFLLANPDFELGATLLDSYVGERGEPAFVGVQDRTAAIRQLKSVQRVFAVAPKYEQMKALLDANLLSARSIARIGKTAFVARYGDKLGGAAQAEDIFARAERVSAAALAVFGKYSPSLNAAEFRVTRRHS